MSVSCRGCAETDLQLILNLGSSPLANTPPPAGHKAKRYPLRLAVCARCFLVQLSDVVPDTDVFTDTYTFYASTSPTLVSYNRALVDWLLERWPEQSRGFVVEVGSNDGDLLQHLRGVAQHILGVDPTIGPAGRAIARGVPTKIDAFGRDVAAALCATHGSADLIIAKNVAAHVADLSELFSGMATLLAHTGIAVVEIQYLVDMLMNGHLDQVYHEHRYFWSVTALDTIVRNYGLRVIDVLHTEPQGGSIRVTLARIDADDNASLSSADIVARYIERERWLQRVDAYSDLQRRADHTRERLLEILAVERACGRVVAGYGAPAKATTLANFCGLTSEDVRWIVDTTPAKQGTTLPGTAIPIVSVVERPEPDTYLVFAHNYLSSIVRCKRVFLSAGGQLIVPLPTPYII